MIKSFKIYESSKHVQIGDMVEIIRDNGFDGFVGLIGKITKNMSHDHPRTDDGELWSIKFDGKRVGTHDNDGDDPSERTRNYRSNYFVVVDGKEIEKRKLERKLRKEKYKHIDPFEEEIW